MRVTITHMVPGTQTFETIQLEGADYESLRDDALAQLPPGRIASHIKVER